MQAQQLSIFPNKEGNEYSLLTQLSARDFLIPLDIMLA